MNECLTDISPEKRSGLVEKFRQTQVCQYYQSLGIDLACKALTIHDTSILNQALQTQPQVIIVNKNLEPPPLNEPFSGLIIIPGKSRSKRRVVPITPEQRIASYIEHQTKPKQNTHRYDHNSLRGLAHEAGHTLHCCSYEEAAKLGLVKRYGWLVKEMIEAQSKSLALLAKGMNYLAELKELSPWSEILHECFAEYFTQRLTGNNEADFILQTAYLITSYYSNISENIDNTEKPPPILKGSGLIVWKFIKETLNIFMELRAMGLDDQQIGIAVAKATYLDTQSITEYQQNKKKVHWQRRLTSSLVELSGKNPVLHRLKQIAKQEQKKRKISRKQIRARRKIIDQQINSNYQELVSLLTLTIL